jgi:hypothetical protein
MLGMVISAVGTVSACLGMMVWAFWSEAATRGGSRETIRAARAEGKARFQGMALAQRGAFVASIGPFVLAPAWALSRLARLPLEGELVLSLNWWPSWSLVTMLPGLLLGMELWERFAKARFPERYAEFERLESQARGADPDSALARKPRDQRVVVALTALLAASLSFGCLQFSTRFTTDALVERDFGQERSHPYSSVVGVHDACCGNGVPEQRRAIVRFDDGKWWSSDGYDADVPAILALVSHRTGIPIEREDAKPPRARAPVP